MAGFHQDERHTAPAPPDFTASMYGGTEPGTRWDEPVPALAAVLTALQRSNHATAFASWTVTTIAFGVVFQARTVWSADSATTVLLAALLPVLAMTARVTVLLVMAARTARTAVGGAWRDEHDPSTGAAAGVPPAPFEATAGPDSAPAEALDRLIMLTGAVRHREALARAALTWAYAAGAAFLAWSLLTTLLSGG